MAEENRTRMILNANRGVANVVEHEVIRKDLQGVADKLFNALKDHYGPYSGFAAVDNGDPLQESTFTKDGIGIIRAIEFASPQEEWVRKTIAYIGTKIESSVGDGTTSAMMFTCAMLRHMLAHIDELRPISYTQLRTEFDAVVADLKQLTEQSKIYVENADTEENRELVKRIVYQQTYTSSHGDTELAEALADIFATTPKELWDRMTYERRTYESPERFVITRPEGQYQMSCQVMMPDMLNKDLSTWFEAKNAKLIVFNDSFRINTPMYDRVLELMEAKQAGDEPLVVISHKRMDTESYQDLLPRLTRWKKDGKQLAIFQIDPDNPKINDFVSLMLLGDIDITKVNNAFFLERDNIYAKFKNDTLTLDGLYETPEKYKDQLERYQCLDGVHMQYTDYMEAVKKFADGYSKVDQSPDIRKRRTQMYRMYAKLRYSKTPILTIGGGTYDNLAMIDVVDDCLRAAAKALTNGIVMGNNRSLYQNAEELYHSKQSRVRLWILNAILTSLRDIAIAAMYRLYPHSLSLKCKRWMGIAGYTELLFADWWYHHSVDVLKFRANIPWGDQCFPHVLCCTFDKQFIENNDCIVQPANTDISMLERFAEVAIKYVLTERIIIHGAAYVDKRRMK